MCHLKSITYLLLFCFVFQTCKSQNITTVLPKVENYSKGELVIKVSLDGTIENEIEVGKIKIDGTIHFNWQNVNVNTDEDSFFMTSIKKSVGMTFCNQKEIEQDNENAQAVKIEFLSVYKYGQVVGNLFPATKKEIEDNGSLNRHTSLVLGSTISWIYSDSDVVFNAKCIVNTEWENSYDFKEITTYNIHLIKGWNILQNTLLEKEDWKNTTKHGSLPKTINKTIIQIIPPNINWYLKYWANDAYLEIEHQLPKQTPITTEQYKNWLPEKIGDLKRVNYEIGKKLERRNSTDNVNLIFENGSKKIDITILDCAGSVESAKDYTMILSMVSTEWKDENDTGYKSSSKMDNTSVMTEYNSKEKTANLYFNTNNRFSISAKGSDIKPEELWDILKELNIKALK